MTKNVLIILTLLALVGGGVWFYLRSITQKSDINYIGTPDHYVNGPEIYPGPESPLPVQPGYSTRPIPRASLPASPRPSGSLKPSASPGRPSLYIGPADIEN